MQCCGMLSIGTLLEDYGRPCSVTLSARIKILRSPRPTKATSKSMADNDSRRPSACRRDIQEPNVEPMLVGSVSPALPVGKCCRGGDGVLGCWGSHIQRPCVAVASWVWPWSTPGRLRVRRARCGSAGQTRSLRP